MADPAKAKGKAPLLTDDDLDEMAKVSPGDVGVASEFYRQHAPDKYKSLLDSEDQEEEDDE